MYRTLADFLAAWDYESDATLKVLRALTDAALSQRINPDGRTLGRLAWHVTYSLREMLETAGLHGVEGPTPDEPEPAAAEIVRAYERSAKSVAERVPAAWTDAMLPEKVPMYGEQWSRGTVLSVLVRHQAHHRGQMTVLMRQAGLAVPGVYGPAREEWAAMGAPAPE